VNRYGRTSSPEHFPAVSKLLAFYMRTVGGTIFLHQGQEIGVQNLTEDVCLHEYKDLDTILISISPVSTNVPERSKGGQAACEHKG
jgi:hypothetical protein